MPGPPLARKLRDPFRSKVRLGDARAQRRGRKAPRPGGEKPRRGGPLAIGALIASVAATLLLSAWNISWQRTGKARADRAALEAAAAKPLKYTDHALCRMDCRHSRPFASAEDAQSEPAWLSHFPLAVRFITEQQVRTALQTGSINHRKSEPRLQPCPKLVVDAHVGKSVQARCKCRLYMTETLALYQYLYRVLRRSTDCAIAVKVTTVCGGAQAVFSVCPATTNVVTVIDKYTNWECYCP